MTIMQERRLIVKRLIRGWTLLPALGLSSLLLGAGYPAAGDPAAGAKTVGRGSACRPSRHSLPAPPWNPVAAGAEVKIDNFSFGPAAVKVAVGTTVTWVNRDDIPHTVVSTEKVF